MTRTIAVCGSCTTRDNFNSRYNDGYRRWYDVVLIASESSMIALMSPPVEPEPAGTREFLAGMAEARPDFLLLDFFGDVYSGVLKPEVEDPDAYLALWVEAMDRFAAFIAEHCPQTRAIVHRGTFQIREVASQLAGVDVAAADELWTRLDEHAVTAYGWDSIDLRGEGYSSWTDNPWGPFGAHDTPDYYHRFLAEMHLRDLRTRLDGDLLDQVELIAAAGSERVLNQAGFLDAVVTAQDARIRELTDQGVVQALRGAWSRSRSRRGARRPRSEGAK